MALGVDLPIIQGHLQQLMEQWLRTINSPMVMRPLHTNWGMDSTYGIHFQATTTILPARQMPIATSMVIKSVIPRHTNKGIVGA
jgi:hypothetical protein